MMIHKGKIFRSFWFILDAKQTCLKNRRFCLSYKNVFNFLKSDYFPSRINPFKVIKHQKNIVVQEKNIWLYITMKVLYPNYRKFDVLIFKALNLRGYIISLNNIQAARCMALLRLLFYILKSNLVNSKGPSMNYVDRIFRTFDTSPPSLTSLLYYLMQYC